MFFGTENSWDNRVEFICSKFKLVHGKNMPWKGTFIRGTPAAVPFAGGV
jgi:hypothetical protein